MKAITSCTDNSLYSFFLPIITWSWNRIGVKMTCFVPSNLSPSMQLALKYSGAFSENERSRFYPLNIPDPLNENREPTYFQCSRLFAAADYLIEDNEQIITTDVDMAVFGDYLIKESSVINIYGSDLVPKGQFPICYIKMTAKNWREVMKINGRSHQECLSELLDPIKGENMRGTHWSKDQETIHDSILTSGKEFLEHKRTSNGTGIATRRADRDGWKISNNIIDSHLPRPGHTDENFSRILLLFSTIYPNDDFNWMIKYREQYLKLL